MASPVCVDLMVFVEHFHVCDVLLWRHAQRFLNKKRCDATFGKIYVLLLRGAKPNN